MVENEKAAMKLVFIAAFLLCLRRKKRVIER